MIGIFLVKLLKISGCNVFAVDINPLNLENAKLAGAEYIFNADERNLKEKIADLTSGRGVDVSFEAVGKSETVNTALELVMKGGKTVLVGNISPVVELPLQKLVTGELKILGSCAIRGEYDTVLVLMSSGRINVDDQVSAVAPLSEGALWFNRLYRKEGNLKKVILVP
jgi:L-iditol 2-dehydrogenase